MTEVATRSNTNTTHVKMTEVKHIQDQQGYIDFRANIKGPLSSRAQQLLTQRGITV